MIVVHLEMINIRTRRRQEITKQDNIDGIRHPGQDSRDSTTRTGQLGQSKDSPNMTARRERQNRTVSSRKPNRIARTDSQEDSQNRKA